MVTIKSSETMAEAEHMRSLRSTTQAEADAEARERSKDDVPAETRWSGVAHA